MGSWVVGGDGDGERSRERMKSESGFGGTDGDDIAGGDRRDECGPLPSAGDRPLRA